MMTLEIQNLKRRFSTIEKDVAEIKGQLKGSGGTNITVDASRTDFNDKVDRANFNTGDGEMNSGDGQMNTGNENDRKGPDERST